MTTQPKNPGNQPWRSLAEIGRDEPAPVLVPLTIDREGYAPGLDRREFLGWLGASLALAGASGCGFHQPAETILPYALMPEHGLPGHARHFASTFTYAGRSCGVLVTSHEGRPTKIEGNPLHPASLGGTDAFAQASVLSLYDPQRSQTVRHLGEISTWELFLADLRGATADLEKTRGAGLRILTERVTSPTTARLLRELATRFPEARRHQYDPCHADTAFRAQQRAFGRAVQPVYRFDQADVVVSLDADFLGAGEAGARYARDFMGGRNLVDDGGRMNRLYIAESSVSCTGTAADSRLPIKPTSLYQLARVLGSRLGAGTAAAAVDVAKLAPGAEAWLNAVVADLESNRGRSIVIAGDRQPSAVHALAYRLNEVLGNIDKTVGYIEPIEDVPADHTASLAELAADLEAGRVDVLLLLGGNPAYTAPADLDWAAKVAKAKRLSVHWNTHFDETSGLCHWHVPAAHYLEAWGDARAFDGTASIVQPLIAPLYRGRTIDELLAATAPGAVPTPYEMVRATWQATRPAGFEEFWRTAVRDGVIAGSAAPSIRVAAAAPSDVDWNELPAPAATDGDGPIEIASGGMPVEVVFAPDPTIWDGRFAYNGWLQELPKPWTRLTWGNAVLMSPATAARIGVKNEQVIELVHDKLKVAGPVWITPGHAPNAVTLHLGYGLAGVKSPNDRRELIGFNAYALRTSKTGAIVPTARIVDLTDRRSRGATTQDHHSMEGRDLVRTLTFDEFTRRVAAEATKSPGSHGASSHQAAAAHGDSHSGEHGADAHAGHPHVPTHGSPEDPPTLLEDWKYPGAAWGMAIDLTRCYDCGACVVACQAENNIPVVGREQVLNGREMHWIRIDRYFAGEPENPEVLLEPMLCQHCEHAPCEVVCPVAATTHSSEGLNEMTYNRCVGTRYCSNNCPYKVRRFNFLEYADHTPLAALLKNPDVTVRSRGVMEKCTYCVQRINVARIAASTEAALDDENKPLHIPDGAVVTACQSACPAQAIVFGDVNDPESRVSKLKADPRNYGVLAELGTRPRTTYLSQVSNPHPSLAAEKKAASPETTGHGGHKA
jgi:molybdopterin-containing oxidoreductase family iron-sulfur binding subunit